MDDYEEGVCECKFELKYELKKEHFQRCISKVHYVLWVQDTDCQNCPT